jgi:hypothetical protein
VASKSIIDPKDFEQHGVSVHGKTMENTGERRFALRLKDGASVTITQAGPEGAWQEAHKHEFTRELYVVSSGWIGYAALKQIDTKVNKVELRRYGVGEPLMSEPGIPHMVYVPAGAVFHVVKTVLPGWVFPDHFPTPELDNLICGISEDQIK